MAMDYTLFKTIIYSFNFGEGLLSLLIIGLSAIVITRDTRSLGLLAFPLALGWSRVSLPVESFVLIGSAIVTTMTLFGVHNIGSVIRGVGDATIGAFDTAERKYQRRQAKEEQKILDSIRMGDHLEPIKLEKALQMAKYSNKEKEELFDEETTKGLMKNKLGRVIAKKDSKNTLHHEKWVSEQEWVGKKAKKQVFDRLENKKRKDKNTLNNQEIGNRIRSLDESWENNKTTYNRPTAFGMVFNKDYGKGKIPLQRTQYTKKGLSNTERIATRQGKVATNIFNDFGVYTPQRTTIRPQRSTSQQRATDRLVGTFFNRPAFRTQRAKQPTANVASVMNKLYNTDISNKFGRKRKQSRKDRELARLIALSKRK